MTEHILVAKDDGTWIITMRRPDKKNALTHEMYHAMSKAIDAAQCDSVVRCLIITGSSGVFTAGNDLADFLTTVQNRDGSSSAALRLLHSLNNNKKPLIAAVDGIAIGIGTTMIFHCDYVVASKAALFSTPFTSLGLVPEGASSLLVPRAIGSHRAFAMLVMGRRFDAEAARDAGFVNEVVAPGHAEAEARKVAREIAALPAEAVATARQLIRLDPKTVAERIDLESEHFAERLRSQEACDAFSAFFSRKAG